MSEGRNLIGVDVGSSSVKLAEVVEDRRGQRRLVDFAREGLPFQTVVDGHIINSSAVVDALTELFHKRKRRDVALRASGRGVIIKKIAMPMMTSSELSKQIEWEAEQHIPFDLAEVQIDYQVVRQWADRGQMDVLLVAAKKEEILHLTRLASEARLRPKVVDLDAFAVQNVFEVGYGAQRPGDTIVLVHVGASSTTLNVLADGSTAFTRDMTIGGLFVTEQIQRGLGVTLDEAERFKRAENASVTPKEVADIVSEAVNTLASEIQRSLDFYLATSGTAAIDRILVSGGCANSPALLDAIGRGAGVLAEALDPLRSAPPDLGTLDGELIRRHAAESVVSVGLALRKDREVLS